MISKEVIQKHLEEIEYKALACETNINNIEAILKRINEELEKANKSQIQDLSVAKDQKEQELETNKISKQMHEFNIDFLRKKL